MATLNGALVSVSPQAGKLPEIIFSGTVKLDSVGVVRKIIGYKQLTPNVMVETTSDSAGDWSLTMNGGSNDLFRIIAVGIDGENSQIFDRLGG